MIPLIILDRDGVINIDSPDFIKSPEEWRPIPGSLEAIVKLNQAGIAVAVASNQSGIGRGLFDQAMLDRIQDKMQTALQHLGGHLDAMFYCPHLPDLACNCRKPKPGLFLQALSHFNIDPRCTPVFAIGDSLRDIEAAKAAGCTPVLVLTGNGEKTARMIPLHLSDTPIYTDLLQAVLSLLKDHNHVPT